MSQRIDQWLWFARLMKTRTSAKSLVTTGRVRVNSQKIVKANHQVKPGDTLTLRKSGEINIVHIKAIGVRRGPYSEAQTLYELERTVSPKTAKKAIVFTDAVRDAGTGRPTKKERRQMVLFKERSMP